MAALDLLEWGLSGERAPAIPYTRQLALLRSLSQILEISGVQIYTNHAPVWAEGKYCKKKIVVYPAMWSRPVDADTIFVSDAYLKYAKPYALKAILDGL